MDYNAFPGAPPMGNFAYYHYPPFMPQSPTSPVSTNNPNNAPPLAQNVQAIPAAGPPYYQAYWMNPPQPFSMPGYIPTSPHSSTIPSVPYHVPIQNLNPYQRVAMAEKFAKSHKAPGAAVTSNVAGVSQAQEHLTFGSRPEGISSNGPATTSNPYSIPPNRPVPPVEKPARTYSRPDDHHPNQSNGASRAHIHRPHRSRGVRKFAGHISSQWLENVEQMIQYKFRDPVILEEALESPGSGINCIGDTHRVIRNGNTWLAAVGSRVIELVLMDHYYNADLDYDSDTAIDLIANATTNEALVEIANATELERFIHEWNVDAAILSDEEVQKIALISVARAVRAVIGAVYEDGGRRGAQKVMEHLGLKVVR